MTTNKPVAVKAVSKKEKILVVEDDKQIRNFICHVLTLEGFANNFAENAQKAMSMVVSGHYDLVLLDLGLPDFDGMQVIKKLREWSDIPIIVISARDLDKDKVTALDSGADDYLTKPFSEVELMARIRVALRNSKKKETGKIESTVTVGELTMDFDKHLVFLDDNEIHLTPIEYSLLSLFIRNAGKVLTSKYILKEVWGITYERNTETLRSHMASLRRKIEVNPANPKYLLTEIGVGYRLNVNH